MSPRVPRARLRAMLGHYSEESGGEWGGERGVREKSLYARPLLPSNTATTRFPAAKGPSAFIECACPTASLLPMCLAPLGRATKQLGTSPLAAAAPVPQYAPARRTAAADKTVRGRLRRPPSSDRSPPARATTAREGGLPRLMPGR
eukprot:scaffold11629_cov131-Isochrysis_galbana.AAC.10